MKILVRISLLSVFAIAVTGAIVAEIRPSLHDVYALDPVLPG